MDGSAHQALFGWPSASTGADSARYGVIGVPSDHGNGVSRGAAQAPAAIRRAAARLAPPRQTGIDLGDLVGCHAQDHSTVLARLAEQVEQMSRRGLRPLMIGGDHSLTYAPVSVLQRQGDVGVVWFDAHTDFSPWSAGQGHSHKQVLRRIEALPGVARVLQVGYRGLTIGDERYLGPTSTVVTTAQARALDAAALLRLMSPGLRWYLSIDIDALDPFHAPGTSAPVPDGLEPAWLRRAVEAMVGHRDVVGADVVEVNPRRDVNGMTSAIAAELLRTIADASNEP
jgi:agmatinase